MSLPAHLRKYVVEQNYDRYTPENQAVWRYIMRQLTKFLKTHAHPCYLDGLKKTGIEIDQIPHIDKMSNALEKFGWKAIPVSGFIPPAAFMEMQSLGYLPIASDMRSINHVMYTPAPDIVHEAAGHAPILVDPAFAEYLKRYSAVSRSAIISVYDLKQYEAIRILSDLKEDPSSTKTQIEDAEKNLLTLSQAIPFVSEAAYLGRMNWWTAEYGLIGSLQAPKIYGAGLLSSVGESRLCLSDKVKKIPLSIECINYAYDITEPQPQLFVTPDFETLWEVLEQLANRMAFRVGGRYALEIARESEAVNTVELNSHLQISGKLVRYRNSDADLCGSEVCYLQFEGPTQLSYKNTQLNGQGTAHHSTGYGTPVGFLEGSNKCLSEFTAEEMADFHIKLNETCDLKFRTGVRVKGTLNGWLRNSIGQLMVLSFKNCSVTYEGEILFQPDWGTFDMAVGHKVVAAFGGPADRDSFGSMEDFVAKVIPKKTYSVQTSLEHSLYAEVQNLRSQIKNGKSANLETQLTDLIARVRTQAANVWLLKLELYELCKHHKICSKEKDDLKLELQKLKAAFPELAEQIEDGLALCETEMA